MDDLKLFAKNEDELGKLLEVVKTFSNNIRMKFNIAKCAKLTLKRGKHCSSSNLQTDPGTGIKELDQYDSYKYLGISENAGISHKLMKKTISKEYYRRLRLVLSSELNSKNKFMAINSLAVPVLTYSFPVVNWTVTEIKRLDTKTRKLLTCHRAHHPKADVDRLYIKRSEGGRGLLQVEMQQRLSYIGTNKYLETTKDWMMKCVLTHENSKKLFSISKKTKGFLLDYSCQDVDGTNLTPTQAAKKIKTVARIAAASSLKNNWTKKSLCTGNSLNVCQMQT